MVSAVYGGSATGIGMIAGGAGMMPKGTEEYYNGDTVQGTQDIVEGPGSQSWICKCEFNNQKLVYIASSF